MEDLYPSQRDTVTQLCWMQCYETLEMTDPDVKPQNELPLNAKDLRTVTDGDGLVARPQSRTHTAAAVDAGLVVDTE